ncbi:MAG: bifunctional ADP-dependent NAD(P)H-hydrate dehydratase/NAD(P)H-hydrate epimerase [Bacteroidetes bacterium 4484_249]|nr:MAG: bifunctional ADP-dependent NAD(P)H-hydrate dehydratase/NAD(P)H-hydrate epimerase [Bacteroidetes bacterium 4484_249]
MKILSVDKIKEADAYTIENEPIADIDLMERAATELFEWILAKTNPNKKIKVFCGLGNNAGDGFAVARMLTGANFEVEVFVVRYSEKMSPSCATNYDRLKKLASQTGVENLKTEEIKDSDALPGLSDDDIVIDAIFGSGLTRQVKGFIAKVIDHINDSKAVVIAIDTPSGFFCDETNTTNNGSIIKADYTLTIQFPKFGFMFTENDEYVGQWEVMPIGLHPDFIEKVKVNNHFIECNDCKSVIKRRNKFSHKGTFGHGLLIAGSYGKMGAAVLAAKAGLKAGAGLITTHIPKKGYDIIQTAVPGAMVSIDIDKKVFSEVPDISAYNAIAVGPGLGTDEKSQKALKLLIQNSALPIIFDADAINILGENKTWIPFIPKGSIFTPHPKEFERLAGQSKDNFDRNRMQREFSIKYSVYVVLKGAHTAITCPDGTCYFNSTGNPGMATGGSGDVLTGILLGLKAQGYTSKETCILGVYIHGQAGDIAAEKWGYEALTAGNITHNLGKAFQKVIFINR